MTNCFITDNKSGHKAPLSFEGKTAAVNNCAVTSNDFGDTGYGGLYANCDNITLTDCTIADNKAWYDLSTGVYIYRGNSIITGCTITGNGQAIEIHKYEFDDELYTAEITNCTIADNKGGKGGIISSVNLTKLTDCEITGNDTGIVINCGGEAVITHCTINSNDKGLEAHADKITITDCMITSNDNGIDFTSDENTVITNCVIAGNNVALGGNGNVTLTNCQITGNKSGMSFGGDNSSAAVADCTITDNAFTFTADFDSKLLDFNGQSKVTIENCTLGNNISEAGGRVISITGSSGNPQEWAIKNCTIADNLSDNGTLFGILVQNWGEPDVPSTLLVSNCAITGNTVLKKYHNSESKFNGIVVEGVDATITNCTLADNNAVNDSVGIDCTFGSLASLKIINSTITGHSSAAVYTKEGDFSKGPSAYTTDIINCSIVNNGNKFSPVYPVKITNSLLWNEEGSLAAFNSSYHSFDHCALPERSEGVYWSEEISSNDIVYVSNDWKPVSFDVTVNGVTHKIFAVSDDANEELEVLIGAATSGDNIPTVDQIGNERTHSTIGAVDFSTNFVSYDITYNLNGGTASNPASYTNKSSDITLTIPTRKGYTFIGWTGTGLESATQTVTIPKGSKGNRVYTATWAIENYTISYDLNNASNPSNPVSYNIESSNITLNNPSKNGYQFDGWTGTDLTARTQNVTILVGSTGNRSYIANFTPIIYTIAYNLNGGTVTSDNPTTYTIESNDFTLNNPTRTGYDFAGWTGTGLESGTQTVKISSNSTGNKEYTATWALATYTISYDLCGGTVSGDNPTRFTMESSDIQLTNPTREGYEFLGWSVSDDISSDVTIPTGTTENLKYVANWQAIIYTISYDLGDGIVSPDNPESYTVESEDFTLINPTKTGYEFAGWTGTSLDAATEEVTISKGSMGNLDFTATWNSVVYALSYDLNGGTVSPDNPTGYTVESDDFTLTNPTKTGYVFIGWSFDDTISIDVTITTGSTGNREYVATWEKEAEEIVPALTISVENLTVRRGDTITPITITVTQGNNIEWSTSGELPTGLTYVSSNSDFVISGTISTTAETRAYACTVIASNDFGTAEKNISITVQSTYTPPEEPDVQTYTNDEINDMTDDEIKKNFGDAQPLTLTGQITQEQLNAVIEKVQSVTTIKTLNLSQVEGISEVILESSSTVENLMIRNNQSIKTVEVTHNEAIKALDIGGSKVETLNASGCDNLEEVNIEGCESLVSLDVNETQITSLNARGCTNLKVLKFASAKVSSLNIEGCESLEDLACELNALVKLDLYMFSGTLKTLSCSGQKASGWNVGQRFNFNSQLSSSSLFAADGEENSSYSDNITNVKAFDEAGNEISVEYDQATGDAIFAKIPASITYDYITGFKDTVMDVTVLTSGETVNNKLASANAGCDFGLSWLGLLMISLLPVLRKKR